MVKRVCPDWFGHHVPAYSEILVRYEGDNRLYLGKEVLDYSICPACLGRFNQQILSFQDRKQVQPAPKPKWLNSTDL